MEQRALITGAAKRIGRSVAEHLAKLGWDVIVHYNFSKKEAVELVDKLATEFPKQNYTLIQADLSNVNEVVGLIPKVVSEIGKIDLLVNNASVFDKGYFAETTVELFDRQMDVNLKAPFFLMRDFANYCKLGNIVNLVDTRITSNRSNFSAYSISKKGLWDVTKMAALELAPKIRVNAIAPGATLSSIHEDGNDLQNLADKTPMKKPGGVDPVLKSIDYILANKHLTGQLLFADGGENLGIN